MGKYFGDLEQLKTIFLNKGLVGRWSMIGSNHKFEANGGGVLTWFKSTGTLQCQGKGASKAAIEGVIQYIETLSDSDYPIVPIATVATVIPTPSINPRLFIVYGHDEISRDQLELTLNKFGIKPFILAKTTGKGLTIIEALEEQVGQEGIANVGIVLLTPDDMGYAIRSGESAIKPRARQNVILEMGMLISKLGRKNTIILLKGDVERPSDTDGIIYMAFDRHIREIAPTLMKRLNESGFNIPPETLIEALH